MHRFLAVAAIAVVVCAVAASEASAHAGLVLSDPAAGAALGDMPTAIRLTFSEPTVASLSYIHVLTASGAAVRTGSAEPVAGNREQLAVHVPRLGRAVYTVPWRVVSAVDGHASAGAYSFGVGVVPTGPAALVATTSPVASGLCGSPVVRSKWPDFHGPPRPIAKLPQVSTGSEQFRIPFKANQGLRGNYASFSDPRMFANVCEYPPKGGGRSRKPSIR